MKMRGGYPYLVSLHMVVRGLPLPGSGMAPNHPVSWKGGDLDAGLSPPLGIVRDDEKAASARSELERLYTRYGEEEVVVGDEQDVAGGSMCRSVGDVVCIGYVEIFPRGLYGFSPPPRTEFWRWMRRERQQPSGPRCRCCRKWGNRPKDGSKGASSKGWREGAARGRMEPPPGIRAE